MRVSPVVVALSVERPRKDTYGAFWMPVPSCPALVYPYRNVLTKFGLINEVHPAAYPLLLSSVVEEDAWPVNCGSAPMLSFCRLPRQKTVFLAELSTV